jgi:ABC-2 type transport system permease protein
LVLLAFVPSAGASLINVAVLDSADPALIDTLRQYGRVELLDSRAALIKRVADTDDIFGIIADGDTYELIAGGNETEGALDGVRSIINGIANRDLELPVSVSVSDMGWRLSPLLQLGGSFIIIFITVFGGMIVLLNLVEEKQYRTLAAVNVSAISRVEFVIGKGLLGFVIPILHAYGILLILGFYTINYLMVTLVILAIALISMIIGFGIGVYNDNQLTAVSSMKAVFLPILASLFGAIFLPERWLPVLWWSPFYWAFDAINRILLHEATWPRILLNCSIILFLTALVFALMRKRIQRGMI